MSTSPELEELSSVIVAKKGEIEANKVDIEKKKQAGAAGSHHS
jgi:hypothetical protein